MAVFNPQISPTNDPNWLGWSKSITQPDADKSMGTLFAGIGDVFSGAVKAADTSIKSIIDQKVQTDVDTERDAYTTGLEVANAAVKTRARGIPTGTDEDTTQALGYNQENMRNPLNDIFSGFDKNIPKDLESLPGTLSTLEGAKANGAITGTMYYGRLAAMAKQLRYQFPGYRDYIDQEFEKVSGFNAANAYVRSLMTEINSYVTSGNKDQSKALAIVTQNPGIPGAAQAADNVQSGKWGLSDVIKWAAPVKQHELDMNLRAAERKDREGNREDESKTAEEDFNHAASSTVGIMFNTMTVMGGITPAKISDILTRAASGNLKLTDVEGKELGALMDTMETNAFRKLEADAKARPPGGGRSIYDAIGPEKFNTLANAHLEVFRKIKQNIKDENWGQAFHNFSTNKSMIADKQNELYTDKDMGPVFQMGSALKGMGDKFSEDFFKHFLETNVDKRYQSWLGNQMLKAVTQPDLRTTGVPATMAGMIEDAKKKNIKFTAPQIYNEYVGLVDRLADPKTPEEVKKNIAIYAFSKGNRDLLSKFEKDSYDEQGRFIPGKYSVYQRMTTAGVSNAMLELGKKNPELLASYRDWAGSEFARLFSTEINNLKDIQIPFAQAGGLVWKGGQFSNVPGDPNTLANKTINKINWALRSLHNVAATQPGADVDAELFNFLKASGYNPSFNNPLDRERGRRELLNLPSALMNAITGRRDIFSKPEDIGKQFKATDTEGGDVNEKLLKALEDLAAKKREAK